MGEIDPDALLPNDRVKRAVLDGEITQLSRGAATRYAEPGDTFELDGGETTRETDIAPPGGYEVLVGVSSGPTNDFNFTMGDCSEQEITVIYERPRELTVDQKQC